MNFVISKFPFSFLAGTPYQGLIKALNLSGFGIAEILKKEIKGSSLLTSPANAFSGVE